jgi:2-dehydropantoate 2-reductase
MNIAVLGAGAMGCLFGGRLAETGHRVVLVDVRAEQVDAINRDGLHIDDAGGARTVRLPARLATDAGGEAVDLVLLFTKAHHSEAALAMAGELLGPDTRVLTLQSGLGVVDMLRMRIDAHRIILGTTTGPSDLVAPARVRSHGAGTTQIMALAGDVHPHVRDVAAALSAAGLPCEVTQDVWVAIWQTLAFNAAMHALTAVTRRTVGQLGASLDGRWLADAVAQEVIAVAQRKGIAADLASARATIAMAFRDHGDHLPSMLQDVLARRATEIDHLNGAVVREAEALGVAVPVTATLWRLVRMLEPVN